jgi:hypothetical protein
MPADPSLGRIHSIGRIVLWVVLAILGVAAVYTAAIALANWRSIGV